MKTGNSRPGSSDQFNKVAVWLHKKVSGIEAYVAVAHFDERPDVAICASSADSLEKLWGSYFKGKPDRSRFQHVAILPFPERAANA